MTTPPVIFTDSAAHKVHELITEERNTNLKLRVYIVGGGCSGFQYGFTFDETVNDDDTIVRKEILPHIQGKDVDFIGEDKESEGDAGGLSNVQLLIDMMSFQYLIGAEIDYKEDLEGARFIIRNPNATTTCGCGASFAVE